MNYPAKEAPATVDDVYCIGRADHPEIGEAQGCAFHDAAPPAHTWGGNGSAWGWIVLLGAIGIVVALIVVAPA